MGQKQRIKRLFGYRHNLWSMAVSQLKAKYANSLLGISWAIVNPLLIALAITVVFTVVFKVEIENFSLFVLAGIFPWMFFSNAIFEATMSLVSQKNLLQQFNIPREAIPLSSVLANFLNFLIGWAIVLPLFLIFNQKIISLLPLLLIVILLNFVFICGLGVLFSVINVFFRDLGHLLAVLLLFWFWATPIFYSLEMIPQEFRWLTYCNPMMPFVASYREILFAGRIPLASILSAAAGWSMGILTFGLFVFWRVEQGILKRI